MITLYQAILDGAERGWSRKEAAERLLRALCNSHAVGQVQGIRRELWEFRESPRDWKRKDHARMRADKIRGWLGNVWELQTHGLGSISRGWPTSIPSRARLAALTKAYERLQKAAEDDPPKTVRDDSALSNVPASLWPLFEKIEDDLTSGWQDDDEKPSEFAFIDWSSCTIHSEFWIFYPFGFDWEEVPEEVSRTKISFTSLSVTPRFAEIAMTYTDEEFETLVRAFPGGDGDDFWRSVRDDKRLGRNQQNVRGVWRSLRNPTSRPGRKPLLRNSVTNCIHSRN